MLSQLASMLRPRKDFDAAVLDGKIYVVGGKYADETLGSVEVYTPR